MNETSSHKALWTLIIIGIIVILTAVLSLREIYRGTPAEATLSMVSPNGGEVWSTGSTHTISWTMRGVPATDKISVTIRRIPPPPLQIEGQEFDPIVFTNLPNTGSAKWTIADMYPAGTYVLGLSAYESTPVTNPISTESAPFQIVPPLSQALYPLYSKVDWSTPRAETFTISTSSYSGTSISSTPITDTMDPGSIFTPFENYYTTKLAGLGWKVDNYLAAGGHTGGQTGYRKAGELVLTRFSILYHIVSSTSPSECPCDVTLSLFSEN
ncbi:MAG: hypothetical protein ABSB00_00005 [Minisyncoccia bacterium]|jgi:hypothetical protein